MSVARMTPNQWIDKFGRAEFEREKLTLATCACDDVNCRGYQVVYPGQKPSLPTQKPIPALLDAPILDEVQV